MTRYTRKRLSGFPLDVILREYESDLQIKGSSTNTIKAYLQTLRRLRAFVAEQEPNDIELTLTMVTPGRVKDFVMSLQEQGEVYSNHPYRVVQQRPPSKFTIHKHYRALKSFGNWLAKNGYDNPIGEMPRMKKPKRGVIQVLTDAEIVQLYDLYNPDTAHGARWQALLAFMLATGCRLGEVITLKMEKLDMDHRRAIVVGKGDKERVVVFGARAHRALSRYIHMFRPQNGKAVVFLGLDGEPMTESGLQNIIRNARKKSGIARLHTHLLRHTFATRILLKGGSEFDLQMLLGHEDLAMTREYVHLAKQLSGPGSMEDRRPDPLDGIDFRDRPQGRRARQIPKVRGSAGQTGLEQ